jgi:hypothetical protein
MQTTNPGALLRVACPFYFRYFTHIKKGVNLNSCMIRKAKACLFKTPAQLFQPFFHNIVEPIAHHKE